MKKIISLVFVLALIIFQGLFSLAQTDPTSVNLQPVQPQASPKPDPAPALAPIPIAQPVQPQNIPTLAPAPNTIAQPVQPQNTPTLAPAPTATTQPTPPAEPAPKPQPTEFGYAAEPQPCMDNKCSLGSICILGFCESKCPGYMIPSENLNMLTSEEFCKQFNNATETCISTGPAKGEGGQGFFACNSIPPVPEQPGLINNAVVDNTTTQTDQQASGTTTPTPTPELPTATTTQPTLPVETAAQPTPAPAAPASQPALQPTNGNNSSGSPAQPAPTPAPVAASGPTLIE